MANKFQKSILERLEQDAVRQKQAPKAGPALQTETAAPVKEKRPAGRKTKTVPVEQEATPVLARPDPAPVQPSQTVFTQVFQPTDIGDYLRREPQRLAKNKTFYLDGDVIEAIKTNARAQGVTDSKLVGDILRRVLGV